MIDLSSAIQAIHSQKLLYNDFLDMLYDAANTKEITSAYFLKEPSFHGLDKENRAYWAATVHFLCNKFEFNLPEWTLKDEYFLCDPFFSYKDNGYAQLYLIAESPREFSMRNMYISNNAFERV